MMKNDYFYWEKMAWAMYSGKHTLFIRPFNSAFNEFYPKTLVMTSALQVMHITHHQGYKRSSILSLLLHFDTATDMAL